MVPREKRVFVWNDYSTWRSEILKLLKDFIDKAVLDELRKNTPEYLVADNLNWLDTVIQKIKRCSSSDIKSVALQRFTARYDFLRGFHGCRVETTESYERDGIRPSDPQRLNEIARQIFKRKEAVEAAIQDLDSGHYSYRFHNQGKVCYCIQAEHLIEDCGHYLLYGSEYLSCIAARTGEEEVLRKRGRAMIVECDIPIRDIPSGYVECLVGQILCKIASKYCFRPTREILLFGVEVPNGLAPENIVCFHFPKGIHNPLRYGLRED